MNRKQSHIILTCYYRPKPGGFCKRLFRAINALLARGHTVHYLAVVPFPIDHPNCRFHRFPWPEEKTGGYLFWAFFHLFAPLQLLYLTFSCRIDRLFAFGHNYALFLQPSRILKRIPLTLFLRADTIENHIIKGRKKWLILLEYFLEGLAISGTRLYGVSQTLIDKTMARHRFFRPATHGVLPNDIPTPKKRIQRKKQVELPLSLACVGVLEPRKNQRFLLEVMKEVPAERAQLYLYGIGPDEQYLRKRVESENLLDRVHFMGWVNPEEIWSNVDLLLMPSLHEGAPNAVLEALGYEVPVLASDIEEHGEVLPDGCLLSNDHIEEWIARIKLPPASLRNMVADIRSQQGIFCHKLQFDWNNIINELVIKK